MSPLTLGLLNLLEDVYYSLPRPCSWVVATTGRRPKMRSDGKTTPPSDCSLRVTTLNKTQTVGVNWVPIDLGRRVCSTHLVVSKGRTGSKPLGSDSLSFLGHDPPAPDSCILLKKRKRKLLSPRKHNFVININQ